MPRDVIETSGLLLHLRLKIYALLVGLTIVVSGPSPVRAEEYVQDPDLKNDGMIEVQYSANVLEPYRQRRSDWATQVSFGMENFLPTKFISAKDGLAYADLFGKTDISIFQISLGTKYNFSLGALTLDLIGGTGTVSSDRSGVSRQLSIIKKAISFGWTLDAIMQEPYVAPYVQGHVLDFTYADKGAVAGDATGTTAWTTGYTVGLLIQLNSIDPTETAVIANAQYGLNNTFLDIFATQYNTSNASDDPQLQSSMNFGAGLKLEF